MDKILTFPGKTDRGIFTYVIDAEKGYLEKTAAEYHPTIASYINDAKPIKGKTQVLITALGAGEWWGDNVNSDYFPEAALAHPGTDYGYETFKHHAKVYKHHINKDPARSYGDVFLSVYNPTYHRVELILAIDHATAPDIVSRIENGEYPDWSMGCKVPFDVCNICGNKAPTRKQYCHHARYLLGRIDPDTGKKVYVINTMPKFFDISLVLIGADRIAKTLKKVAYVTSNVPILSSSYLAEKAAEQKRAEMEKEVPPNQPPASQDKVDTLKDMARSIADVKAMEPPMPDNLLDTLAKHPLPRVLSTMAMMGIIPKPQEFQRIFLINCGHGDMARDLASRNECFDPMSVEDPSPEASRAINLGPHNFDDNILKMLSPHMENRSYLAPHLGRRIVIMIKSGSEYPLPKFIKVSAAQAAKERTPINPTMMLLIAAGAYAALTRHAPMEALKGMDKLLATPEGVGLAAVLGLGLIHTFNKVTGPSPKGQFSPSDSRVNPDANDVFSRIEEMKQKPFNKVGMQKCSIAKRLILGPSAAYMASGVLQKHKEMSPYDEEGRIKSFVRRNPDVISAALVADAVLTARGSPLSTRSIFNATKSMASKFASAASEAGELYDDDLLKTADAQDFLTNSLIWPLAMGRSNLPGRVVGGLFDQAVLESGKQILEKRKGRKVEGPKQKSGEQN